MKTIDLYVFPFGRKDGMKTRLLIDGMEINSPNNKLTQFVVKQPMSRWLKTYRKKLFVWRGFLYELVTDLNDADYVINFFGRKTDFEQFSKEVGLQKEQLAESGRTVSVRLSYIPNADPEQAVKTVTEALLTLMDKAYDEQEYELYDQLADAKNQLIKAPVRLRYTDEKNRPENNPADNPILNTESRRPRVFIKIINSPTSPDALYGLLVDNCRENRAFDYGIILLLTEYLENAGSFTVLPEKNLHALQNTFKEGYRIAASAAAECNDAINSYLYNVYFPPILSRAIDVIDHVFDCREDWKTEPDIDETAEKIENLFKQKEYSV